MKKALYCIINVMLFTLNALKAQWVKTNGPEGITVTSFFNEDTILLCGTYAQGVFRSHDHGNSWTLSNSGLENKWIDCFAQDDSFIYAGSFGEGVFRSHDKGYTWQPANTGIQTQAVYSLLVADGYLLAGTVGSGLFRSADQGDTWADANGGALGSSFIFAMVYQSPRLMVEADNYIFYSFDFGDSWYVDQGPTQFYVIHAFFQEGDTILAAAYGSLFRTTDGGVNWIGPTTVSSSVVGFDNIGDTVFAGTATGVYYSIDWGVSWVQVPATGLRTGASAFVESGNNLLLGREEIGVAITSDKGASWTQTPLSDFTRASTIDNSMISANNLIYSGTHGNRVFSTPDHGDNWTKIGTSNQFDTLSNEIIFSMLALPPDILLACGCGDGLFRSADNGVTWTHINGGLPQQYGFTCVKTLAQCGTNVLAALTDGVYYSTDSGITWNATNLTGSDILQAGGFAVRDNIACVGIIAFPSPTGIYRSTDYGVTWSLAEQILDIETMATGGNNTMYAGELFTSYVSYDDGITWQGLGLGAAFTMLAWDNYALIGNNEGVFFSDNYGSSWAMMNEGMDPYPNNAVQGLTKDNQYIYAGTFRDAVWRRPLSDFGIATGLTQQASPANEIIIFPNPATSFIKILLPEGIRGNYSISISDVTGKDVLAREQLQGNDHHSLMLDVKSFVPGLYTITIKSESGIFNRKFVKASL